MRSHLAVPRDGKSPPRDPPWGSQRDPNRIRTLSEDDVEFLAQPLVQGENGERDPALWHGTRVLGYGTEGEFGL